MHFSIQAARAFLASRANTQAKANLLALFQYFSGELALKLISLFLVPLNTRFLSPADYGRFSLVISFLESISPAINLGLVSHIAVGYNKHKDTAQSVYISSLFNFRILYGLLVSAFLFGLGSWFYLSGIHREILQSPLLVAILVGTVSLYGINFIGLNYYNVRGEAGKYSLTSVGIGLSSVAINVFLLVGLKLGFLGLCLGLLLSTMLGFFATLYAIKDQYVWKIERWAVVSAFMFAWPALPHLFSGTIMRMLDRFFLASVGTMDNLGSLSIAQTLASPILMIGTALMNLIAPKLYAAHADSPRGLLLNRLERYTFDCSVIIGILSLFVYLFAHCFVALLPDSYRPVLNYLSYALVTSYFLTVYWFVSIAATITKSMFAYSLTSIPLLVLGIAANQILSKFFGSSGVIMANLLVALLQPLIFLLVLRVFGRSSRINLQPFAVGLVLSLSLVLLDALVKKQGYAIAGVGFLLLFVASLVVGVRSVNQILSAGKE